MAERYPIVPESSPEEPYQESYLGIMTDEEWSQLRRDSGRPVVEIKHSRLLHQVLLGVLLGAVLGAISVGLYLLIASWPGVQQSAQPAAANEESTSATPAGKARSKKGVTTHRGSGLKGQGTSESVVPAQVPDIRLALTWPQVAPPLNAEVISGSGPTPIRISSPVYQIDVGAGTVLLIRNRAGAPLVDPVTRVQPDTGPQASDSPEGMVLLRVWTDSQGLVREVQVLSGSPKLAAAAVNAARQWQFVSAQNKPPQGPITIQITFRPPAVFERVSRGR